MDKAVPREGLFRGLTLWTVCGHRPSVSGETTRDTMAATTVGELIYLASNLTLTCKTCIYVTEFK